MNDRHEFRVWDNEQECYVTEKLNISMHHSEGLVLLNSKGDWTKCNPRCIIEQCTGLKGIFDGDKLSVLYPKTSVELTGIVIWHNYKWVVEFDDCSRLSFDDMVKEQWEVKITGNIHDKKQA